MSIEETLYGLTSKPNDRIQAWFQEFITTYCHIIVITPEIAQISGEMRGTFRTQGKPRTQADMLIAATAQIHQITLVTRNIKDFERCQISILNPFTDF